MFVAMTVPPAVLLLGSQPLRDYAYRELAYRVIADRVTAGATDDRAIVRSLLDYMATHEYQTAGAATIDATVLNDLVRGVGWCDQQAWGLSTLLAKKGIPSTMLLLRGRYPESRHTVATVLVDGDWRIVDPYYHLVFHTPQGAWATFDDFQRGAEVKLVSRKGDAISLVDPDFHRGYFSLFERRHPPVKWRLPSQTKDLRRRVVSRTVDAYVRLFGSAFVNAFQDAYLRRQDWGSADAALFYRARHYDLFFRRELALRTYQRIIEELPDSRFAVDARYFVGRLQEDLARWSDAAVTFESLIARADAGAQWRGIAPYFYGVALDHSGRPQLAIREYRKSASNPQVDSCIRVKDVPGPAAADALDGE